MFASDQHHQLPAFISRTPSVLAAYVDAFKTYSTSDPTLYDWHRLGKLYINPPWDYIHRILRILRDSLKCSAIMVVPTWPSAPWWTLWLQLTYQRFYYRRPCYLDETGSLRPKPSWDTCFGLIIERDQPSTNYYVGRPREDLSPEF
jgi:hypothetical protein